MRSGNPRKAVVVTQFALLAFTLSLAGFSRAGDAPLAPTQLRCEYLTDPMGIDVPHPRFSCGMEGTERDHLQSAYQLLIATSAELLNQQKGDQWDSGEVKLDNSTQVTYEG